MYTNIYIYTHRTRVWFMSKPPKGRSEKLTHGAWQCGSKPEAGVKFTAMPWSAWTLKPWRGCGSVLLCFCDCNRACFEAASLAYRSHRHNDIEATMCTFARWHLALCRCTLRSILSVLEDTLFWQESAQGISSQLHQTFSMFSTGLDQPLKPQTPRPYLNPKYPTFLVFLIMISLYESLKR